jgi:hypothetical protein
LSSRKIQGQKQSASTRFLAVARLQTVHVSDSLNYHNNTTTIHLYSPPSCLGRQANVIFVSCPVLRIRNRIRHPSRQLGCNLELPALSPQSRFKIPASRLTAPAPNLWDYVRAVFCPFRLARANSQVVRVARLVQSRWLANSWARPSTLCYVCRRRHA